MVTRSLLAEHLKQEQASRELFKGAEPGEPWLSVQCLGTIWPFGLEFGSLFFFGGGGGGGGFYEGVISSGTKTSALKHATSNTMQTLVDLRLLFFWSQPK